MKKGDAKNGRGFTIIEVSLVLAIAGLIFLMVFIALPSLQRTQRDARRRDDVMIFLEKLKKYQSNNRGALPSGDAWNNDFFAKYFDDSFIDPSGGEYQIKVVACGNSVSLDAECSDGSLVGGDAIYSSSFPYEDYSLLIVTQATCSGDKAIKTSNPRNVAVLYRMEGAGVYCNNS